MLPRLGETDARNAPEPLHQGVGRDRDGARQASGRAEDEARGEAAAVVFADMPILPRERADVAGGNIANEWRGRELAREGPAQQVCGTIARGRADAQGRTFQADYKRGGGP